MRLDNLFEGLIDALTGGDRSNRPREREPGAVEPSSRDPYGDPADGGGRDVRPASEDPYGDPGDLRGRDIRSSSEDPYGDPADDGDETEGERVLPSSRDPYGDPADRY